MKGRSQIVWVQLRIIFDSFLLIFKWNSFKTFFSKNIFSKHFGPNDSLFLYACTRGKVTQIDTTQIDVDWLPWIVRICRHVGPADVPRSLRADEMSNGGFEGRVMGGSKREIANYHKLQSRGYVRTLHGSAISRSLNAILWRVTRTTGGPAVRPAGRHIMNGCVTRSRGMRAGVPSDYHRRWRRRR